MISVLLLGVLITMVLSIITTYKAYEGLKPFILVLTTSLVLMLFSQEFLTEGSSTSVLWISLSMLMGSIVIYHFLSQKVLSILINSLLPFLLLLGTGNFQIGEYSVGPASLLSVLMVLIGFWILPLTSSFAKLTRRMLSTLEDVTLPLTFVLLGIAVFIAYFFQSLAGIFFLTLGLALEAVYNRHRDQGIVFLGLTLLIVFAFNNHVGLDQVDFVLGKNLLGFFVGLGMAGVVHFFQRNGKFPVGLLALALFSLFMFLMLFLGTQKNDLGGMDAYAAAFVGSSLYSAIFASGSLMTPIFLSLFASGLLFLTQFPVEEAEGNLEGKVGSRSVKNEVVVTETDPFDSTGLSIAMLDGAYNIVKENAELTFELGPKGGRTKGAFKEVKGVVQVGDKGNELKLNVELPVSGLSTFNRFRDESLMEAEYFNASKYPIMSFKSSAFELKGDVLELKGAFTMLGKRLDQLVELKYVGSELRDGVEYPVLIGRGSIDRTDFGMRPDPKEGNVVDFKFRILLQKQ